MSHGLDAGAAAALLARPDLARLLDVLNREGEEARVVGGAVRNALIGRPVHEVDIATTAPPQETMRRAKAARLRSIPTGLAHGTVTVLVGSTPFEVTTLREDIATDGRHAVVRFGRDFAADARRRDFTINALSLTRDGRVADTVGGLADLAARRVRFIGDSGQRIREDYLRILRFFRFHADYADGAIDPDGFEAAIRERDGLAILSRERIRTEFLKLLVARRAVEAVRLLSDAGLLLRLVAGVADLGRLARAVALDEGGADPILRLGALLAGTTDDAERLREQLRLSNAESERLVLLARVIARARSAVLLDAAEARRLTATFGTGPLRDALAIMDGEPRPCISPDGRAQLDRLANGSDPPPVFPVAAADLLARGVKPGPEMGRRLVRARAAWLDSGCPPGMTADAVLGRVEGREDAAGGPA